MEKLFDFQELIDLTESKKLIISEYMCSGVGEKVFEKCDFTMCSGNKCNSASSYSGTLLVPTLLLTYFQY